MADFNHNYVTVDDCTSTSPWSGGSMNANAGLPTVDSQKGSDNVLRIYAGSGVTSWYRDLSGSERFDVTKRDFVMWFYYLKGKADQYLIDGEDGLRIRFYYDGGTSNWLEWDMGGNLSIVFGWNCLKVSGFSSWRNEEELSNASAAGGDKVASDYSTYGGDVTRLEILCDFANGNDGSNDVSLGMDHMRHGTHIVVGGGTEEQPLSVGDVTSGLVKFNEDYGLGVVQKRGQFLKLDCGLKMGDDTTNNNVGTTLTGHFKVENLFVLNNQLSNGVKHTWEVLNNSTLRIGDKDTSGKYDLQDVDETQSELQEGTLTDVEVDSAGYIKLPVSSTASAVDASNYCSFSADTPGDDWIKSVYIEDQNGNVLLDDGNYNSGYDYKDVTSKLIECYPGDTLTIYVVVDASDSWTQSLSWGHSIDTADLSKVADLYSATANYTHEYTWTVPDKPGNYLVSWWEHYDGYDTGCTTSADYACRIDYTLSILSSAANTGNRVTQLDLSTLTTYDDSLIEWTATVPTDTSITIETRYSLDNGSSWSSWQTCTNDSPLPGLTTGDDLSNALLECKQTLSRTDETTTPELSRLAIYLIEESEEADFYPAIKGCQLVVPDGRFPDFICNSGCKLKIYNSKLYRWFNVTLSGTVEILTADLEYNENIEFKSTEIDIKDTELHHNSQQSQNNCGSMTAQPNLFDNVKIHHCEEGLDFNASGLSISGYWAKDNNSYDLTTHQSLDLINSVFDETKVLEVT